MPGDCGLGITPRRSFRSLSSLNHKRHGTFTLGSRSYDFRMKAAFPKTLSLEFLLVDLVNNLDQLGEDAEDVLKRVKARVAATDRARVMRASQAYGSERTKKVFNRTLAETETETETDRRDVAVARP